MRRRLVNCRFFREWLVLGLAYAALVVVFIRVYYADDPEKAALNSIPTVKVERLKTVQRVEVDQEELEEVELPKFPPVDFNYRTAGQIVIGVENGSEWNLDDVRRGKRAKTKSSSLDLSLYPKLSLSSSRRFLPPSDVVETSALIYNRVPKCASSTIQMLLARLEIDNNFTYRTSNIYTVQRWTSDQEREFVRAFEEKWRKRQNGFILDRHFYHLNFSHYDPEMESPKWFNVVRHPIDRIVSNFYYLRHPKRWKSELPPRRWREKDFSECVLSGDPECAFDPNNPNFLVEQQLTYFCGSAAECSQVGNWAALQVAKRNVESDYVVVGDSGNLEMTVSVLEALLPRFFKGAVDVFARMANAVNDDASANGIEYRRNANPLKRPPTSEAYDVLSKNISAEIEFYEYVVQRLLKQHRLIEAKKTHT